MKGLKKVLSVFLVVVIMLTAAPLSGFVGLELPEWLDFSIISSAATSGTCGENVMWTFDDATGTLTISGTGAMTDYRRDLGGDRPWDNYEDFIVSVVIEDGITTVGADAFNDCENIIEIILPNSITSINEYAFSKCNIEEIRVPNSVTSIGTSAFSGCDSLKNIVLPNDLKNIGFYAFCGTSLESVVIPDSVTSIGYEAFSWCTKLKNITLSDSLTTIASGMFAGCTSLEYIVIPDSVTKINSEAFYGCSKLESVVLGNNVTHIYHDVFYNCSNLKSINLPNSLTYIGDNTFQNCSSLRNISLPENLTKIGDIETFAGCSQLEEIIIPNNINAVPYRAFTGCSNLKYIKIGNNVTSIGEAAFRGCKNLVSVMIPESVTYMSLWAFGNCGSFNIYYSGSEKQWNQISMDSYWVFDESRPQIHYNSKQNTNTNIISSSPNDIVISTKRFDNTLGNVVDMSLLGVKCTIGSKVTENNIYTITFNIPSSNDSQKVTLSKDEFQNYIIPKAVIESWKSVEIEEKEESNPAYNHTAMMKKDTKDGKPYVSTVFARKGNNEYLNAAQSEIKVFKNKDYEIIISADNLGGKSCTYYIEQDAKHKISSSTGVFSSVDLYSKLDFDKACYAYVKTSDGVISELVPVNFTKQPANAFDEDVDFLKSSTFNLLGGDFLGFTIPSDVPLIGDAKISLNAFQLPAGFEYDGDSLKISIGANIFHTDNTPENAKKQFRDKCFTDWKKLCDDTMYSNDKKARNKYKNAKKDFENRWFGKAGEAATSKNWDVNALGYIDATIVNGQTVVKEAYLSLGGEFSFKYTQQGAIWVIPAYIYAQMGAYFGGAANGSRVVADSEIPFQWDWTLKLEPKVQIGAGAGVKDVLSAGIWANATTPVVLNFTNNHLKWDLTGAIGIEAEFCVLKAEKTLFEGSMNLVNKYFNSSPKLKMMMSQQFGNTATTTQTSKTEVSVIDRDYLDNTSSWLNSGMLNFYSAAENGLSLTELQTSVFNQASPQVVAFRDKMLMTWVEDDASRDTYNRMRLMYSIYENGVWSTPVAVCDDGKNDMNPVIATDGTDVYISWQKIKDVITEDTATVDNLIAKTEIYTAKFDADEYEIVDVNQLTDNDCYDYEQTISLLDGVPYCYWVSCEDNNMTTGYNHSIYRYEFDGETKRISYWNGYILDISAASVNGVEHVAFSMDADDNTETTDDVCVYTLVDGLMQGVDKCGNNVAYPALFYGKFNGEQTLFTSDMGNIYYVQNDETKSVFDEDRLISGNFNYIIKDNVPTIFWTEREEIGNAVYSTSYENGTWTAPVKVSNTDTQLSSVDVAVYNNQFRGVCTSSNLKYNETKEDYECVKTNLCSFIIGEVQDISVDDIYIDEKNIKIGEVTEFDVYVTNNGTETINSVSFEITDTLGFTSTVTKNINLASGEGAFVTLSYTAPTNYTKTTLTVTATCNEIVDNNTENDTATKEIGKSSLALTESEVIEVNGQYLINAMITNESDVVAENVVINTLLNDSEDVVDTMTIESIGARETYSIEYVVTADDLTFDEENDTARVYITVDETNEKVTGNKICYVIAKPVELECGHISTEVVNGYEPTCTTAGSEGCVQCTLCGEIIEELGEIPAAGHNYSSEVVEPTCTEDGYTIYTCNNCNDSYNSDYVDAHGHLFVDYVCEYCGETAYNYTFSIQTPSRTEIRNKDGIILHANVDGTAPSGSYVRWESSNGNFDKSADGSNLKIIAKNKGYTTFTAILCDADGNELARDTVEMYSKSGFFDKIGGFFRSLFGTTKIYEW